MNSHNIELLEEPPCLLYQNHLPPSRPTLFDQLIQEQSLFSQPHSSSIILLQQPSQNPPSSIPPSAEASRDTKKTPRSTKGRKVQSNSRRRSRRQSNSQSVKNGCSGPYCFCQGRETDCNIKAESIGLRKVKRSGKMKRVLRVVMSPYWTLTGWPRLIV